MKPAEAFKAIESENVTFELGLASGRASFLKLLDHNVQIQRVIEAATNDDTLSKSLAARALALTRELGEAPYRHPHDIAIAAYFRVLSRVQPVLADLLRPFFLELERGWWARTLAETLHSETRLGSNAAEMVVPISGTRDQTSSPRVGWAFASLGIKTAAACVVAGALAVSNGADVRGSASQRVTVSADK